MRRIILFLILIILSVPSFCQVNGNGSRSFSLWQKNGIVVNDSQGRPVRQNARSVGLDDGTFVVIWEDERNGYTDIYAQRLSSSGKRLWGEQGVPVCASNKNQAFPQIINAGNNTVIITWQDYRDNFSDIYVQKLNINGERVWQLNGIPVCRAQGNQLAPQLCSDDYGGAIITWYDYRSGKGEDIYAQRISSTGSPEWISDGAPVCVEFGTQWYPQILRDGNGGAVICWDDKRSDYYDIYSQRLNSDGTASWEVNGIAVCSAPENQEYNQMASCEGGFVVTWQDYRNGEADIYAQKITLAGRIGWKMNGESVCNVAGNQERPQIVGGSKPIIVWTDFRNGTGNSDIYCQKLFSDGKRAWKEFGVPICEMSGDQGDPRAASDGSGGAVIIWKDNRNASSTIAGRHITADGKPVWSPEGKIISAPNSDAEFPQIIPAAAGSVLAVWQDSRNGGTDIYAQSIDPIGSDIWRATGINIATGFGSVTQQKPRVIKSGPDGYVVAFEDYRNGYSNIYVQKINNGGKILWNRDAIRVCAINDEQNNPNLASDGAGGAIIVWEDGRNGISNIYAQRVDSYGTILWDEGGIKLCNVNSEQKEPVICKDEKGGTLIAWVDARKKDGSIAIYIQRIDKNGSLSWDPDGLPVSTTGVVQKDVKIAPAGLDSAVLTWVEFRRNVNESTPDILAQRIDPTGKRQWQEKGLGVCRAPEAQRNPQVAADDSIIIAWEDAGSGNYDIYAQKLNTTGSTEWVCDGIPVCTAPFTQHEPQLVHNDDGGATITWEDYRKANWDIYAQRIDGNGVLLWEKEGVAICTANGTQYAPQIVNGRNLSSIIVWEDYRNNISYNIFAQKVSGSGNLLWDLEGVPVCITPGGGRNPQIVDDNEGGAIIVWTDYRYGNYDIYAQRINETSPK